MSWFIAGSLLCAGCHSPGVENWGSSRLPRQAPGKLAQSRPVDAPTASVFPSRVEKKKESVVGDNALDQAAACIERGDSSAAVTHLKHHLNRYPDQIMIRAYMAEILFKMKSFTEAKDQYERFIAAAQDADGPQRDHIVHCHTRLMEIAQQRDDDYGENLHRGIGMVLLVRQLEASGVHDDVDPGFRERLLCKAAAQLNRARKARPDEPQPSWYLVEVWTKLAQPRSAEKALQQAKQKAALLPLPPAEQRALVLASSR